MLKVLSSKTTILLKATAKRSHDKRTSLIFFIIAILFSFFLLNFRRPDALVLPQLWAEDGTIFFQDVYNTGIKSFALPYAGYFHLIPRLVAYFTYLFVPYAYVPVAYVFSSLAGFILVLFYIWNRTGLDVHARFLMCLGLTLVPISSEIVLNLTNVQWYTAILLIVIFLSDQNRKKNLPDAIIVFLTGLTGPFSLIFLPCVLLLVFSNSYRAKLQKINPVILSVFIITALIQLISILTSPTRIASGIGLSEKLTQLPYAIYIHLLNIPGLLRLYTGHINYLIFSLLLAAIVIWIYASYRQYRNTKDFRVLFLIMLSFSLIGANLYGSNISNNYTPITVGRYFFLPTLLLIWSGIIYVFQRGKNYYAFYLLYFWYFIIILFRIGSITLEDKNWKAEAQKIDNIKKDGLQLPINPEGWYIKLNNKENH
ncbi:MAG: hypothetical protein H7Y13_17625 [Sphingobacteriaceae bacterium]|nr:hypothetical protein [Sphingobacteriaceae bacterium]